MRPGWVKMAKGVYHRPNKKIALWYHHDTGWVGDRAGWYWKIEMSGYWDGYGPYPTMRAAMDAAEKEGRGR